MAIDIVSLSVLFLMALFGYMRGLFSQAWSLASLVVSFFGARPVLGFLERRFALSRNDSLLGDWLYELATGVVLYIVLLIIGYVLEKLLVERFKIVSAGNRVLGGVLGFVKGGAAVLVVLWLLLFFSQLQLSRLRVNASSGVQTSALRSQLQASRVAALAAPHNPLNLLLLARIRPYLPNEVTGSKRPPISPPAAIQASEAFQALLKDQAFLDAYREHEFMKILANPAFRKMIQDVSLLGALERSQH